MWFLLIFLKSIFVYQSLCLEGRFKIQREVHVFWQWQWAACHCLEEYGHHCRTKDAAVDRLPWDSWGRTLITDVRNVDFEASIVKGFDHLTALIQSYSRRSDQVQTCLLMICGPHWQWLEAMARAEAGSSCYRNIVDQRNKHFKNTCFLLCLGNILLLERRWTRTVAFPGFPAFEPCRQRQITLRLAMQSLRVEKQRSGMLQLLCFRTHVRIGDKPILLDIASYC